MLEKDSWAEILVNHMNFWHKHSFRLKPPIMHLRCNVTSLTTSLFKYPLRDGLDIVFISDSRYQNRWKYTGPSTAWTSLRVLVTQPTLASETTRLTSRVVAHNSSIVGVEVAVVQVRSGQVGALWQGGLLASASHVTESHRTRMFGDVGIADSSLPNKQGT